MLVERQRWATDGSLSARVCRARNTGVNARGDMRPRKATTKVLDLCAGKEGWGAAPKQRGHDYVALELFTRYDPRKLIMDVQCFARNPGGVLDALVEPGWRPDVILASPPCEGFSVASIGRMWDNSSGVPIPKHDTSETGLAVLTGVLSAIHKLQPQFYWMENPRGMMRKMPHVQNLPRVTVSYCSYAETRQKPSDLWGRWPETWTPRPFCTADPVLGFQDVGGKRFVVDPHGRPCHESAPRGAKTGTQGIEGSADRAIIPFELSLDVCLSVERALGVAPLLPQAVPVTA